MTRSDILQVPQFGVSAGDLPAYLSLGILWGFVLVPVVPSRA